MARSLEEIEWEALSAAAPDESTAPQVASNLTSPACGNSAGDMPMSLSPALSRELELEQRKMEQMLFVMRKIESLFKGSFQSSQIDDDYDNRGEREYRLWRER